MAVQPETVNEPKKCEECGAHPLVPRRPTVRKVGDRYLCTTCERKQ